MQGFNNDDYGFRALVLRGLDALVHELPELVQEKERHTTLPPLPPDAQPPPISLPPPASPAFRRRRPPLTLPHGAAAPRFPCIQALPPSRFPCPEAPLTQPPACHLTSFPRRPLLRWASHRYQPASEPSLALDRTAVTAHDGDRATGTVPRWGSSRRHRPMMGIAPLQPHRPTVGILLPRDNHRDPPTAVATHAARVWRWTDAMVSFDMNDRKEWLVGCCCRG
ncbi:cyclin-dependent kinase 12 [Triticum aestivum]|uniref:cyclin-dependent kinase 12 n=1 Tax=Triticum aestivum TaxID=4565 RepID=UPI001D01AB23|nr:cyclin-dependent kinase 12-like [Triticum aestivum]